MTDTNTAEREALMNLADAYAQASFDQGLHQRTLDDAPEEARAKLEKALRNALAGRASLAASAGSEPVAAVKDWAAGARFALEQVAKIDHICWLTDSMREIGITQAGKAVLAERDRLLVTHPSPPEGMAGWISVDERLPQPFTTVLIHPRPTGYCCEGEVNTQRQWSYGEYETGFGHHQIKCKVTHWQPLPAPPLPASEAKELR